MPGPTPRILMCPPDHYGIEYEINPWMRVEVDADRHQASQQWQALVECLERLGAKIELMRPVPGCPDMVFTANAGVVVGDLFVTSRFRHPERQPESEYFEAWFADHGYRVVGLLSPLAFEGAGDALPCGEILYTGYIQRSDLRAQQLLARLLGCEALGLELVDPRFYHLDTCFCPIAPNTAIYFPRAFDHYGRKVLEQTVEQLIECPEPDAIRFGCNAVVLGTNVVLNSGTDGLCRKLEDAGFKPHPVELSEFLKAGGSAKCLTLRLDGEEASRLPGSASATQG